jgi:hypothetical protein
VLSVKVPMNSATLDGTTRMSFLRASRTVHGGFLKVSFFYLEHYCIACSDYEATQRRVCSDIFCGRPTCHELPKLLWIDDSPLHRLFESAEQMAFALSHPGIDISVKGDR